MYIHTDIHIYAHTLIVTFCSAGFSSCQRWSAERKIERGKQSFKRERVRKREREREREGERERERERERARARERESERARESNDLCKGPDKDRGIEMFIR